MVILDTNVIIDHLRVTPEKSILIKLFKDYPNEKFAISVISIQELYEGKSTLKEDKENQLISTLGQLEILPYTGEVARKAGEIIRDSQDPLEFADAAIAATAISNNFQLSTLNRKHFKDIPHLDLFSI